MAVIELYKFKKNFFILLKENPSGSLYHLWLFNNKARNDCKLLKFPKFDYYIQLLRKAQHLTGDNGNTIKARNSQIGKNIKKSNFF